MFDSLLSANDCFLTFVVFTPNRATPYESRCYIMKRTDRQVRLEVEPPLLISDDVKIEFFTRPRLDYVGLHPKLWRKGSKEFHFWLNTFFVDADMNGGLAHDILAREHASLNNCESWSAPTTARVALDDDSKHLRDFFLNHSQSAQEKDHHHHHRGDDEEEEDELDDDVDEKFQPKFMSVARRLSQHTHCEVSNTGDASIEHLIPPRQHQTVVGMANIISEESSVATLAELMKKSSLLLDESVVPERLKQPATHQETAHNKLSKNGRISHITLTSSISNASSSSSSSSSLVTAGNGNSGNGHNSNSGTLVQSSDTSVKTTAMSFNEKRMRHASVPQTTSSPGAMTHLVATAGERKTGHNSAPTSGLAFATPSARPVAIDGTNIALRLNKSQIDKAAKDKQCKVYSENFNVTLFLIKPTNQSDDLIDYSQVHQSSVTSSAENFHHITVTPVMTSASTTSCNVEDENGTSRKSAAAKTFKVSKKAEPVANKSKKNLMQLSKKQGSSTDDDAAGVNHFGHGQAPPVSPRAVTFAEQLSNDESIVLSHHGNGINDSATLSTDHELNQQQQPQQQQQQPSQSTWI